MGLSDVLNGMKNGPAGGAGSTSSSGGMSPLTMGLLAFLAYKALKGSGVLGSEPPANQPRSPLGSGSPDSGQAPIGTDWLTGLQKVIAGGGAGSILSGGLSELLKRFQQAGQGQAAEVSGRDRPQSIVSAGGSRGIGADTLDAVAQRTGIPRDRLLAELREMLPSTVDAMTPNGRLPNEKEAARWG